MNLNYEGEIYARIEASEVEFEKDESGKRRYVTITRNDKQEHLLIAQQDTKYADYESDTTGVRKGDLIGWSAIMADAEGIYRITMSHDDPVWCTGKHYLIMEVAWFEGTWQRLPEIERVIRNRSVEQFAAALEQEAPEAAAHDYYRGRFQKAYHAEGRRGVKRTVEA